MTSLNHVLGFDFGGTKAAIAIGAPDGSVVWEQRLQVADFDSAEELVTAAIRYGKAATEGMGIAAVGVATMGVTTPEGIDLAPNVNGWQTLNLWKMFHESFSCPVGFENDVRAALLAEQAWGNLRPYTYSAYLNLGSGIALAFFLDGRLYKGAHQVAGEIGYAWEPGDLGYLDHHAPLEERVGGLALNMKIQREFPGYESVLDAFHRGWHDPAVHAFLIRTLATIARYVGYALLAVDVEAVAVGGGISAQFERIAPIFLALWRRYLPKPPLVMNSAFYGRAGLMGALKVAWDSLGR
ncbi:ROK family protein [Sulfobacillus acidophilus DSM 10332]|uniref:ROK family protein n=1 Tax=Sulfobacillus acidophilus (strain ATCC 700253 / DSM 10332 / NAL) TaxID=679936 RepID=G8TTM0_SULAD|nr:ROK family protein [Sulfobacillus acidophilus DSM 10332]